jgi:hypothetical protein
MKVLQFSTTDAQHCIDLHSLRKLGTALHAHARRCGGAATSAATEVCWRHERKTGAQPLASTTGTLRVRDGGLDLLRRAA